MNMNSEKAREMLDKFDGKAPYDGLSNIVRSDGYFAQQIEREFGMPLKELRKAVGR